MSLRKAAYLLALFVSLGMTGYKEFVEAARRAFESALQGQSRQR